MRKIIVFSLFAILFTSCSKEYKLAYEYIRNTDKVMIMILPCQELNKFNQTLELENISEFSDTQLDSIAWYNSAYVQYIDDSEIINLFQNSFKSNLNKMGLNAVFTDDYSTFENWQNQKMILGIDNIAITESYTYDVFDMICDFDTIEAKQRINKVDFHTILNLRYTEKQNYRLSLNAFAEDQPKSIDCDNFRNEIPNLSLNQIYYFTNQLGELQANLLVNFLMNRYIREKSNKNKVELNFYYEPTISFILRQDEPTFDVEVIR